MRQGKPICMSWILWPILSYCVWLDSLAICPPISLTNEDAIIEGTIISLAICWLHSPQVSQDQTTYPEMAKEYLCRYVSLTEYKFQRIACVATWVYWMNYFFSFYNSVQWNYIFFLKTQLCRSNSYQQQEGVGGCN